MKISARIGLCVLISLSSAVCRAERIGILHNFHKMSSDTSEMKLTDSNHKAWTKLLTYTCTGDAVFGANAGVICLNLPKNGSQFVTSKVEDSYGFLVIHDPAAAKTNVKVYVSPDSVTWKQATGDSIDYKSTGAIDVKLPRGDYYFKVRNTKGSNPVYIRSITHFVDNCPNCFDYEE